MAQQGCKQPKWQKQPVLVDFMWLIWSIWFILKILTPKLTHVNVPVDRRSNKCRIWRCTPELDLVFFQLSNLMCHIPRTIRGLSTHVRRKLQNIFISENLMGQQKHSETLLPSLSWNLQVDKDCFVQPKTGNKPKSPVCSNGPLGFRSWSKKRKGHMQTGVCSQDNTCTGPSSIIHSASFLITTGIR